MKKPIVVATREPARVNRLLSVLAEWLQINAIIKAAETSENITEARDRCHVRSE